MSIDKICALMHCTPAEAPKRVAALIKAARQSKELLDGLRVDFGVGEILTPGVKDLYKDIDGALMKALPEVTNG